MSFPDPNAPFVAGNGPGEYPMTNYAPGRVPTWGPAAQRWTSPLSGRFAVLAVLKCVGLMIGYVVALVIALLVVSVVRDTGSSVALAILILLGSSIVMLTGIWAFIIAPLRGRWDLIGWKAPAHSMAHLLWQIPLVIVTALTAEIAVIAPFTSAESSDGAIEDILVGTPLPVVAIGVILVCGVVPIWEELFFRGVLFGVLRTRFGRWAAVLVGGAVFALVHGVLVGFPYLATVGICLCIMAEWYRSVVPGIILHSVNNALVVLALLTVAGAG